jgi:hypothetical protein
MCLMAAPLSAKAFDPVDGAGCNQPQTKTSAACSAKGQTADPISGPNGILIHATHIVAYIAGAAAIVLLIIGGIRYITSGGDPSNVKSAKDTVVYALIGLAVIVLADALVTFIVGRL